MLHASVADVAAEELLEALARLDETLACVASQAGSGDAELERRLEGHLRGLRPLLDEAGAALAGDVVEAARAVLAAAEPEPAQPALARAHANLAALIHRRAGAAALRTAA